MFGADGLWMELNAEDGQVFVTNGHDDVVCGLGCGFGCGFGCFSLCCDLKTSWEFFWFDYE